MQAIITKYMPATNTKAAYFKATTGEGSNSIKSSYDYELTEEENHLHAAVILAEKLQWKYKTMHQGSTKTGYVFVLEI
jgi:hypothetical protein